LEAWSPEALEGRLNGKTIGIGKCWLFFRHCAILWIEETCEDEEVAKN